MATFATTVFVLKFLTQEEYGLASLAFIFMGIFDTIIDFGFGAALIQKKNLTDEETSSAFWLLVCFAIFFIVLANLAAIAAAWFFDQPKVEELIHVIAFVFLVSPIQIVYRARLSRELNLPLLSQCDLLGLVIRSLITVALATKGAGIWCIITGFMAEKFIVATVIVFAQNWLPLRKLDVQSIKLLSNFGLKITADRIVYYLLYRMDSIIIAKLLGTHSLALYSYAQQFIGAVLQIIMTTGVNVVYPLFSRYQNSEKLLPTFYNSERIVGLVSLPALLGVGLLSHDLVLATVGPNWDESSVYIQGLAIAGIFQIMAALMPQLLNALDRTSLNLLINLCSVLALAVILSTAISAYGEKGFIAAIILFQIFRYIVFLVTTRRVVDIDVKVILIAWGKTLLPTICMAASVIAFKELTNLTEPVARLLFQMLIGIATYCLFNLLFFPRETSKAFRLLRR